MAQPLLSYSDEYTQKIKPILSKYNLSSKVKISYSISKGNIYLRLDYWDKKQKKKQRKNLELRLTGIFTEDKKILNLAHEIQLHYNLRYIKEKHGFKLSEEKDNTRLNFYDLLEASCEGLSDNSIAIYKTTIGSLKKFTGKDFLNLNDVDEDFLRKYFIYLAQRNKALSYQEIHYKRIKKVFTLLNKKKIYVENPTINFRIVSKEKNKIEVLTIDELKTLIETPCSNVSAKNCFLFACNTGLRISDLIKLTFADIQKNGDYYELYIKMTKTKDLLRLKLNKDAEKIFLSQKGMQLNEFVFQGLTQQYIRRCQVAWFKSAGVTRRLTFHSSRHTFAVNFLNQPGVDIYRLKEVLGHNDIKSTLIYAQYVKAEKYKALDGMPELINDTLEL